MFTVWSIVTVVLVLDDIVPTSASEGAVPVARASAIAASAVFSFRLIDWVVVVVVAELVRPRSLMHARASLALIAPAVKPSASALSALSAVSEAVRVTSPVAVVVTVEPRSAANVTSVAPAFRRASPMRTFDSVKETSCERLVVVVLDEFAVTICPRTEPFTRQGVVVVVLVCAPTPGANSSALPLRSPQITI